MKDLDSPRWEVRRDAFERIMATSSTLTSPEKSRRLITLLEKEDFESGKEPPDLYEDDDYVAYDERVGDAVEAIAEQTHQRRAWRALLNARYNSESKFSDWIAGHIEALPVAERLIRSPYASRRMNGLYLTAAIVAKGKPGAVSPQALNRIRSVIRAHIRTDILPVQYDAIVGLGLIGNLDDAVFLENYAAKSREPTFKDLALAQARSIRSRLTSH